MAVASALGSCLALQVNLPGIGGRHGLVVLHDDMRQVRAARRSGLEGKIAVIRVVEVLGTKRKAAGDALAVDCRPCGDR